MSLEAEIELIDRTLAELSARLEAFEEVSRKTIIDDRNSMLGALQKSLESTQKTILLLDNGNTGSKKLLTYQREPKGRSDGQLVTRRIHDMSNELQRLQESTNDALIRAKNINRSYHDFDSELDALRSELSNILAQTQRNLSSAQSQLETKRTEVNEAKESQQRYKTELSRLEQEMEERIENRNIMRGFRIAAWSITAIFPPAALVATPLEIAAGVMRSERNDVQGNIDRTELTLNSLLSELETLEQHKVSLEESVSKATALSSRVAKIENTSTSTKKLVIDSLQGYQENKESTDNFAQWSTNAHDYTETIVDLCDDEGLLRKMTERLMEMLNKAKMLS